MLVEVIDNRVPRADELEMSLIRIGNQNQRIVLFERGQEFFRYQQLRQKYGGPCTAEFGSSICNEALSRR